jgi:hypothetical protein
MENKNSQPKFEIKSLNTADFSEVSQLQELSDKEAGRIFGGLMDCPKLKTCTRNSENCPNLAGCTEHHSHGDDNGCPNLSTCTGNSVIVVVR